jgi:dienelactone hydrolase
VIVLAISVAGCKSRSAAPAVPKNVIMQDLRPKPDGLYGRMYTPRSASARGPAVLTFGGSEGGLIAGAVSASGFATAGIPSLALAYFKEPDLPSELHSIPLEYFVKALQWLASQPAVDPHRIFVSGVSRGSEAALLLGVRFPELVHGVIALVPSNLVGCGVPPHCDLPAWTLDGGALPFKRGFGPSPGPDPAVLLPVENLLGPTLFVCGGDDHIWDSCGMANAMVQRLDAHRVRYQHQLLAYPGAGHGVGALPVWKSKEPDEEAGASQDSNAVARKDAWPRVLAFVRSAS